MGTGEEHPANEAAAKGGVGAIWHFLLSLSLSLPDNAQTNHRYRGAKAKKKPFTVNNLSRRHKGTATRAAASSSHGTLQLGAALMDLTMKLMLY
jgi:hypothetical protein